MKESIKEKLAALIASLEKEEREQGKFADELRQRGDFSPSWLCAGRADASGRAAKQIQKILDEEGD